MATIMNKYLPTFKNTYNWDVLASLQHVYIYQFASNVSIKSQPVLHLNIPTKVCRLQSINQVCQQLYTMMLAYMWLCLYTPI